VQVYDAEGHFPRGWFVNAFGEEFRINTTGEGHVEVFTARSQQKLVYSQEGRLLTRTTYMESFGEVGARPVESRRFGFPWILWPFSHPFAAWITGVIGTLGVVALRSRARPSNEKQSFRSRERRE
jgi:hypothetical protein